MVNKVILIGRLGKDPVIKHFSNDNAIAEFTVATSDNYKNKEGQWVDVTDWHNVKLPFKRQAEYAEKYLKKGGQVFIEGKIRTRSYDDKDGNKRYITEVVAETVRSLEKREGSGGGGYSEGGNSSYNTSSADTQNSAPAQQHPVEDDLPF